MLVNWNKKINLTKITEPDEIVIKHFYDSLTVLKHADIKKGASLIDVGTGAGFPGIPLLIARPDIKVTLLDSTEKKLIVLEDILKELELSANLLHMRAEDAAREPEYRDSFDLATARAVAEMRILTEYCLPFVKVGGEFVAMKGSDAEAELQNAEYSIKTLGGNVKEFSRFTIEGCGERSIIVIEKVKHTTPKYPRNASQIKNKPL